MPVMAAQAVQTIVLGVKDFLVQGEAAQVGLPHYSLQLAAAEQALTAWVLVVLSVAQAVLVALMDQLARAVFTAQVAALAARYR